MNDNHQYLKDEHLEDDEDDENNNLEPSQHFVQSNDGPDEQLEGTIMEQIIKTQKRQDSISQELEKKHEHLLSKIGQQSEEQLVKMRMSQLALSKILVYTHGKSEFRLVIAHHHMGKAYLNYKCYEQAIDHLTVALKKNSKLNEIKQVRLYHSHLLTTLSKCYFEISSFQDALEVLSRAEDIQNSYYTNNMQADSCNIETVNMIANCYSKLKNYSKAHQFIQRAYQHSVKINGNKSSITAKIISEKAKIYNEQKNYPEAIKYLDQAIQILIQINYPNKFELCDLEDLLAGYYQKNEQYQKQIQTLFCKLQLTIELYDEAHKQTLKLKRSIATILIKHNKIKEAISLLEEILQSEEKIYGTNSIHAGKTLKMLGTVYMNSDQDSKSAEHYLKRAQKILHENGNTKLVKEIKNKLQSIKESCQKRINVLISQN